MTKRASLPPGKALFYRSMRQTDDEAQPNEAQSSETLSPEQFKQSAPTTEAEVSAALNYAQHRLALYDKLSESIHSSLSNAIALLNLAEETRMAAQETAEDALAQIHAQAHGDVLDDMRALSQQKQELTQQLNELKLELLQLREEKDRVEAELQAISDQKQAAETELREFENQRQQAVAALQERLDTITKLQDSLRGPLTLPDQQDPWSPCGEDQESR